MVPARHINPPDWMTDYKTAKLMRVLGGYELPAQAMFVGGCVRNSLLEKPVKDIDVATIHHPLQVIERLSAEGIRYVPTGLEHGTVTAIIDDATFEITTLRKDMDTDGRHAVIAFTEKWTEDALRRDFTVNTLLASPDGSIFDPTGKALTDLDKRVVVFVGDPAQRIAEDYLRILRFFRFHAYYGEGAPDATAIKACRENAGKIASLSKERVTQELLRILEAPNTADILDLMFANDVLVEMAEPYRASVMERLDDLQRRHNARSLSARLAMFSDGSPDYFDRWLVLSNAQKRQVEIVYDGAAALKRVTRKTMRKLVYKTGNDCALQSYLLALARKNNLPDLEIMDIARYWQAPVFPVNGDMLLEAGLSPGPMLGKTLKALEEKWIAQDFPAEFSFKK